MKIGLPKEIKDNEYRVGLNTGGRERADGRGTRSFRAENGGRRFGLF